MGAQSPAPDAQSLTSAPSPSPASATTAHAFSEPNQATSSAHSALLAYAHDGDSEENDDDESDDFDPDDKQMPALSTESLPRPGGPAMSGDTPLSVPLYDARPASPVSESLPPFGTGLRGRSLVEKRQLYWRNAAINVSLILAWYLFSTLISVYNKWMFSPNHYNFSYPLFVTTMHMTMQFALSGLILASCWGDAIVPRNPDTGKRLRPTFNDWAKKVAPCAIATALDIGLSNLSLKTITLTFYTMCKSSNLAFVLMFAFLFRLEAISWRLIGIIAVITLGVVMMVAAETKFVLVGALEVLTASSMGGLRWTLTQILLDKRGMGLSHPIGTIFWLSPIMAVGLVIASLALESWHLIFTQGGHFGSLGSSILTIGMIILPGGLAFAMNMSEYTLIQRTSVVTLSVAGIFKEVLTVIVASTIFGDELTPINVTGLCITLVGIGLYNWLRYRIVMGLTVPSGGRTNNEQGTNISMSQRRPSGSYTQVPSAEEDNTDSAQPMLADQHDYEAAVGQELFDADREPEPSSKGRPSSSSDTEASAPDHRDTSS